MALFNNEPLPKTWAEFESGCIKRILQTRESKDTGKYANEYARDVEALLAVIQCMRSGGTMGGMSRDARTAYDILLADLAAMKEQKTMGDGLEKLELREREQKKEPT